MKKRFKKENRMIVPTILAFLALIGEMSLYRKTFINFWLAFSIFIGGGLLSYLFLRKRWSYFSKQQFPLFWQGLHAVILFGGPIVFSFMALNYYLPLKKDKEVTLMVVKAGSMISKGRCSGNYAIVNYADVRKQLVFDCDVRIEANDWVKIKLNEGLFGFLTVNEMAIEPNVVSRRATEEKKMKEEQKEQDSVYTPIIEKAEEYADQGNRIKAIELYERAVSFRPSDSIAKKRLIELKEGK